MANHKSSKKRILRNNKRNEINSNRISRIRTYIKKVETEISSENKDKANEAFKLAMPEIQRGVSKGLMHKNTASRKLSRLSNKINMGYISTYANRQDLLSLSLTNTAIKTSSSRLFDFLNCSFAHNTFTTGPSIYS